MKKMVLYRLSFLYIFLFQIIFSQNVTITFNLDMSDADAVSDGGVFVAGGSLFGVAGDNPLVDTDGDGIYTGTVTLPENSGSHYTFLNGNCSDWSCKEQIGGQDCSDVSNYNDRRIDWMSADTTVNACFARCGDGSCSSLPAQTVQVTFSTEASAHNSTLDAPVSIIHVTGSFEGWSGAGVEMTDPDGDGIYIGTADVAQNTSIEYKYIIGGWGGTESGAEIGGSCDFIPTDEYNNYGAEVGENPLVLPTYVFGQGCTIYTPANDLVLHDFETPESATNAGTGAEWTQWDESQSALNYTNLTQLPAADTPELDSPVMMADYGVDGTLVWGGYSGVYDKYETPVDLTGYNFLSFKFYNLVPPTGSGAEALEFRVILWDISDVTGNYVDRGDVETWWAFFKPDVDESPFQNDVGDGWVEYRIPLLDNGSSGDGDGYKDGFANPGVGWGVSIAGNDALDINSIGGIAFEMVFGGAGNQAMGTFLIEDVKAIYSEDIPGCTDASACNFNADATLDDGSCYSCVDVTFNLDMSSVQDYTSSDQPYIAGGTFFSVPGNPLYALDYNETLSVGDALIFSKTVQMKENTNFNYTYTRDGNTNYSTKENIADQFCADVGNYNDRDLTTTSNDTIINACYANCTDNEFCSNINYVDITFSVNMEDVDIINNPTLSGGSFPPPGITMTDADNDMVYEATVSAATGATLVYKFANSPVSDWNGPAWETVPAACEYGNHNDRSVVVPEVSTVLDTVCFSSCENCIEDYPIDVLFNVDMGGVTGFDGSESPYVFGSFNDWDPTSNTIALSDNDGDNIYTGTLTGLMYSDSVTVLFGYGSNYETVPAICGIADPELGMFVRGLPLTDAEGESVLILDPIAYGGCPPAGPSVHLRVDVSSVVANWPDEVSLCVVGSFNNWGSTCFAPMTDEDGDNIYEAIIEDLTSGANYEFKFLANGGWGDPITESGASIGSACDFNPGDDFGNYGFTATETLVDLGVYGWNECNTLSNDIENTVLPTEYSSKAYPNPFNPYVNIAYELPSAENVRIDIVNLLGQNVKTLVNKMQAPGSYTFKWNGKDANGISLNSGMYFAVINRESGRNILKITYLK